MLDIILLFLIIILVVILGTLLIGKVLSILASNETKIGDGLNTEKFTRYASAVGDSVLAPIVFNIVKSYIPQDKFDIADYNSNDVKCTDKPKISLGLNAGQISAILCLPGKKILTYNKSLNILDNPEYKDYQLTSISAEPPVNLMGSSSSLGNDKFKKYAWQIFVISIIVSNVASGNSGNTDQMLEQIYKNPNAETIINSILNSLLSYKK
jgi:hypothetical protein